MKFKIILIALLFCTGVESIAQITKPLERPVDKNDPSAATVKYLKSNPLPQRPSHNINPTELYLYFVNRNKLGVKTVSVTSTDVQSSESRIGGEVNNQNCVTANYRLNYTTANLEVMSSSSINDGWLLPSSVLDAESLIKGSYNNVNVTIPRNPINISTDAAVKNGNSYVEIANPENKSVVMSKVNELKTKASFTNAADISYVVKSVYSEEDLSVKVNGYYNNSMSGLSAKLAVNFNSTNKKNYLLIDFTQRYFSIYSDQINPDNLFKTDNHGLDLSKLVYISAVHYGRRAIMVLESEYSQEDMQLAFDLKASGLVNSGGLSTDIEKKRIRNSISAKVVYYGGSARDASEAVAVPSSELATGLQNYIRRSFQGSGTGNALPIGYVLRFVNNGSLCGIQSIFEYKKQQCQPKIDSYRLRVTLTDIQCVDGRDGSGNPDDYALTQFVEYKSKGHLVRAKNADYNKFPEVISSYKPDGADKDYLITGNNNSQIHVNESANIKNRNVQQINNSLLYDISYDEYSDPYATFKIHTWLKEYSTSTLGNNDDKVYGQNDVVSVNIKMVLDILTGLAEPPFNEQFYDKSIGISGTVCSGTGLSVIKVSNSGKVIIEGPIMKGSIGAKAAVWVRFELVQ